MPMWLHTELQSSGHTRSRALHVLIRAGEITLGGNRKLKIYGKLNCRAGKRMGIRNRVFFKNKAEAVAHGCRPCGICLPEAYAKWQATQL